jgi:hypothetical protein
LANTVLGTACASRLLVSAAMFDVCDAISGVDVILNVILTKGYAGHRHRR